jgi:DNA-binding response OmpR family regulator
MTDGLISQLTALVVDDRESSRYLVSAWLKGAGFSTVEAGSGGAALDVLATQPIDLAILDVNLPDMSGFQVCERIRASPSLEWMPVIHLSATAVEPADRSEGLMRGADAYVTEPVEPAEFLAIVSALVRRSEMRRRNALTTARLRALNAASADLQAASSDERVFQALADGAAQIAGIGAVVVTTSPPMAWRSDGPPTPLDDDDAAAVDAALAPARAGHSSLTLGHA